MGGAFFQRLPHYLDGAARETPAIVEESTP